MAAFLSAPPEGFLQATEAVTRLPPAELELLVCVRSVQPVPPPAACLRSRSLRASPLTLRAPRCAATPSPPRWPVWCQALQVCKFLLQRNGSLSLEDIATKASQSVGAPASPARPRAIPLPSARAGSSALQAGAAQARPLPGPSLRKGG